MFNECVTLDIKLSLVPKAGYPVEQWTISQIDYRILMLDNNFHALLGACIDFITAEYPTLDLVNFLGLLFIIHHDASEFYRERRDRFTQSIRIDHQDNIKIKNKGVEISINQSSMGASAVATPL